MNKEQIALELTKIFVEQKRKNGLVISSKQDLLENYNYFLARLKGD